VILRCLFRAIRRRVVQAEGRITFADSRTVLVTARLLLDPLEQALRAMSWAIALIAAGLAVARLTGTIR
jgi:hypothetical protein